MIKKEYKDYTIIIEEQKPSVPKPETEEQWDKHFETHGGETKGTCLLYTSPSPRD